MITINLKDFYPWYGSDEYIDIPEEVALELFADKRYEAAHERKMKRRKVISFSDYGDKTWELADQTVPDPHRIAELRELLKNILEMLDVLSDAQARRIRAHIILEMTLAETAELEKVSTSAVHSSVQKGLKTIRQKLEPEG